MSAFDEEDARKPVVHEIGSDLSLISVDELELRIDLLRDEIRRLEVERDAKQKSKNAAASLFRS